MKLRVCMLIATAVFTLSACKKSYHCECGNVIGASHKYTKSQAKDGESYCRAGGCTWITEG